jgi:hypothetical protein
VAALANQLARLIRPLHGTSPVEWGSGARWLAPVWCKMGLPPKLSRKNDQRPRRALSACGLMTERRGKVNAALAFMRQSAQHLHPGHKAVGLALSSPTYGTKSGRDRGRHAAKAS